MLKDENFHLKSNMSSKDQELKELRI
jgi:hypothetical protein